jgi:glycosyltransferase involved in cell wall biosynthesis
MRLCFMVPASPDAPAGGDAYLLRMMAALAAGGTAVTTHPVSAADAMAVLHALPADTIPVIDDGCLPALRGAADAIAARRCIGLIHHRPAADRVPEDAPMLPLAPFARIVTTSDLTAAHLASACGVDPDRIAVVQAGVDAAPRRPAASGGTCEILSAGPLIPRQGHDRLIQALARLFDLDWHLTIMGTADDTACAVSLAALTESLSVAPRVRFSAPADEAAVESLWAGADIFALATPHDGDGVDVAAALRRGLPVGVIAGGAATALVTPAAGLVCDAGDVVTLSKALRRVIFDTTLRSSMAEAAWQIGQTLPDWPTQARAFATAIG